MRLRRSVRLRWLLLASAVSAASPALGQTNEVDLASLSLEELAQVDISSVSRRPQALAEAPAAVFVINREDIRRSGAVSLPEVLRLAPNLQVQRVNAGDYVVSARGFNGFDSANKVLVLIDGRSLYTTLFSGVLWDAQGTVLEDIERIEVISGPGGTLYGANAVNGVINIITRSAFDTQGAGIAVNAGDEDRTASLRQGWSRGAWAGRAFATAFDRDATDKPDGSMGADETDGARIGFRADRQQGASALTLSGELYEASVVNDSNLSGGHLNAAHTLTLTSGGSLQLQGYYDLTHRVRTALDERVETIDVLGQYVMAPRGAHQLIFGGGYRQVDNSLATPPGAISYLSPMRRDITLSNLFVQDEVTLNPTLAVTLGMKLEDSSFTGQEFLPSVRVAWTRPSGALVWAAVSRAVRTPSRIDRDLVVTPLLVQGNFQSEVLIAYEAGYRASPTPNSSISISAFYNDYDDLRTVGPISPGATTYAARNDAEGRTYGVEAWGALDVRPGWRLTAGVASLHKDFALKPGAIDLTNISSKGYDPSYQVMLGSTSDLSDRLSLDLRLRGVGKLPGAGVDAYIAGDLQVRWRLTDKVDLSFVGSNLLAGRHLEVSNADRRMEIGPSYRVGLRAGF